MYRSRIYLGRTLCFIFSSGFFSFPFFDCFLSPFFPRFLAIRITIPIRMYISPNPFCSHFILNFIFVLLMPTNPISSASQPTPHNLSSQFTVRHRYHHLTSNPRFFHFSFHSPIQFTKFPNPCTVFSDPLVVTLICTTFVCMMYRGKFGL